MDRENIRKEWGKAKENRNSHGTSFSNDLELGEQVPVYLPVVMSTWKPDGQYLQACHLDNARFRVLRPPAAETIERLEGKKNNSSRMPTPTSCAEWDGFVEWSSRNRYCNAVWY